MITCIFGHIGAGKSYHAVSEYLLPGIKDPNIKRIVTNISGIRTETIRAIWGLDCSKVQVVSEEQVWGFWRLADTERTLFIIDEIQNFYGSSNYRQNKDSREELKIFFTKCRHDGHSVIYICQVPEMVHTDILRLTESFVQCAKLNFIKFLPSNRYTWIARKTYKTKGSTTLSQGIITYDPKVYVCYESTRPGVTETNTKSDKFGFIPWRVIIPILLLIVGIFLFRAFFVKSPPPPKGQPVSSPGVQGNTNPAQIDTVDGWYSDGKRIHWLKGPTVFAMSSDSSRRWGVIKTDIGFVYCRPYSLAPNLETGFDNDVVSSGNGQSVRNPAASSSPVSSGAVP